MNNPNKAAADQAKAEAESDIQKNTPQQVHNEQAWAKLPPNQADGLQHWPDGRKWYTPDYQEVGGVNNYYARAYHSMNPGKEVDHTEVSVESIDEIEARKREVAAAVKTQNKHENEDQIRAQMD